MRNLNFSKEYINNDEEIEILQNESKKNMNSSDSSDKKRFSFNFIYFFSIILFLIVAVFIVMYLRIYFNETNLIHTLRYKRQTNFESLNETLNKIDLTIMEPEDRIIKLKENEDDNNNETLSNSSSFLINDSFLINNRDNGKIGVAFVYKSPFGNGIGRMLSVLCSALAKIDKYDIYLISGPIHPSIDFPFHEKVIRVPIIKNKTLIEKYDKSSNIKIYVLQNDLTPKSIKWYQNLNGGKKVIGVSHGVYMSSIFANLTGVYSIWKNFKYYDAYIQVNADDYYVNKRLGINNSFFLPNLYTFDPETTPSSNLTYNNVLIIGRELDRIKGGKYGVMAMDIVRREIPDAKLYLVSSNYKITFLENLIKELNLTNNIQIVHFTKNLGKYFLNSSVFINPSLSEACPMVLNEAKAYGMAIVGFNVSYSVPYQTGVITTEIANYTQMAEEIIKLLKDYNYRKQKGFEAKESMKLISDNETLYKWMNLFEVLVNNDMEGFKKLQEYTFDKRYYDEETARDHLESNWKQGQIFNKYFCCHDFNDMLNITYINNIKGCKNQSLCK